ncbi:MAG: hypothetical protein BMS9Abin28_1335 [Anaerolineae bacterium]|nr:MAG: hypothetical protein BMS9Abin28_1335 [Anaerolineae bacterium]
MNAKQTTTRAAQTDGEAHRFWRQAQPHARQIARQRGGTGRRMKSENERADENPDPFIINKETPMSETIMQLNFKYDVSAEDYTSAVAPLAEQFAAVSGLRWKIWMINEDESEAGGIYLFEDDAALQTFLESDLAAAVTSHPALRDFSVKPFKVMEEQTAVTRGPVHLAAAS